MDWYMVSFLGICLGAMILAQYKYSSAETNSYQKLLVTIQEVKGQVASLEREKVYQAGLVLEGRDKLKGLENQCKSLESSVEHYQEHFSRLRDQQYALKELSYPRKVEFSFPEKPLSIEILEPQIVRLTKANGKSHHKLPTKKIFKKVKSQIRGLNK